MKRFLLLAVSVLVLACSANGSGRVSSETIRLRHLGPEEAAKLVKVNQGISQLLLSFKDNTVTVTGDEAAIAAFKADLLKADAPPVEYKITMHLVRTHVDANGKHTDTVVMAPTFTDFAEYPATMTQGTNESGYSILMTPNRCADDTVNLTTEIRELGIDGDIVSSGKNVRNVKLGETVRTVGMTDAKNKAIRRAVHKGEITAVLGSYDAYYLDVEVVRVRTL
jgi:hypothetical protein